jgi:hypothetical protein
MLKVYRNTRAKERDQEENDKKIYDIKIFAAIKNDEIMF